MASIEDFPRVDMSKHEATLTAETVKQEFESALKEFQAMGAELISAAKKCESLTIDVQTTIRETAEAYRQEGKRIFEHIEEHAVFTEDVRKSCENVRWRIIEANGGAK